MNWTASALLLALLLWSEVSGLGSVVGKTYLHIRSHSNWTEAQEYCRSNFVDLALVQGPSDEDLMHISTYYAWIGLYWNSGSWKWSKGDSTSHPDWPGKPPYPKDGCAYVYSQHAWLYAGSCSARFFFICNEKTPNKYQFAALSKNWSEARDYCMENHYDLATFPTNASLSKVVHEDYPNWIGLRRAEILPDGNATWNWSVGASEYRNWGDGEPLGDGSCVTVSGIGKEMAVRDCGDQFPFVCVRDSLVLVKENKTWEEALEHCRNIPAVPVGSGRYCYELLSVQAGADENYVVTRILDADTEEVWVGLRFLAGHWLWLNKADVSYEDLPECPGPWNHCGALSKTNRTALETRDCAERRNFLCYEYFVPL